MKEESQQVTTEIVILQSSQSPGRNMAKVTPILLQMNTHFSIYPTHCESVRLSSKLERIESTTPESVAAEADSDTATVNSDDAEAIVGPLQPSNSDSLESTTAVTPEEEGVTPAAAESNGDTTENSAGNDGISSSSQEPQTNDSEASTKSTDVQDDSSNAQNSENQNAEAPGRSQNQNSQSEQSDSQNSSNVDSTSEATTQKSKSATGEKNAQQDTKLASKAQSPVDAVFSKIFPNAQGHPLLSRILLAAAEPSKQTPQSPFSGLFRQQQQQQPSKGLLGSALNLFKIQSPVLSSKRHVRRSADEEEILLTPKPFEPFPTVSTTRRPTLIEKYHRMSSDEKVESASKFLERIMHGVTIAGHVDGYLTNRAKATLKKLHKLFATSEEIN